MSSQAQIDANRRNAQKSTGPATPEGRAAVRLNALKHGLTSTIPLLNDEDRHEFNRLCEAYEAEYQPVGPTEEALLRNLVAADWRMGRARRFEVGFFAKQSFDLSRSEENYATFNTHSRLSIIVDNDSKSANTLVKISRYEIKLERSFYKALNELRHTQEQRKRAEPVFAKQTQLEECRPETAPPPPVSDPSPSEPVSRETTMEPLPPALQLVPSPKSDSVRPKSACRATPTKALTCFRAGPMMR